jgi:3-phosphoshikimate 1-carboxyvinyltransferase
MKAVVQKSYINGSIQAPPSKSYTHRALICALLSSGRTVIRNPLFCDDTRVTLRLSELMGGEVEYGHDLTVTGPEKLVAPSEQLYCEESGTSLRVFTAISALVPGKCILDGGYRLRMRPISELLSTLNQLGVTAKSLKGDGRPPVEVLGGQFAGGTARIRGDITSQYITGLLLACAKAKNETNLKLETHLESRPYVEMTLEVMRRFGVFAEPADNWANITIPGQQEYRVSEYSIEGDFSSAAFALVAGAIAGAIEVRGLRDDTNQGDAKIVGLLQSMGVGICPAHDSYFVSRSEPNAVDIDASDVPDLVPVLAVLATKSNGMTRLFNAARLRYKESNRLATISQELRKMGARIDETDDGITIRGPTTLHCANIDCHGDHRIAMACVIAGLVAEGTTVVEGIECISKSYPRFIEDMQSVGGQIQVREVKGAVMKK